MLSLVMLLSCTSSPPPAEPAAPPGPVRIELDLQCPAPFGTFRLYDLADRSDAPPHPTAGARGAVVTVGVGGHYGVAVEESEAGFSVSVDVDRNGQIDPSERKPIDPDGARPSPRFALPARTRTGAATTVAIGLRTSMHPDGEHRLLELHQGCLARGVLPDGAPFGLRARSGVLDHDGTELILDLDGDGSVDFANRLASVRLGDGEVHWAGRTWALSFEQERMVLTPTGAPVAGLRPGAPAPDVSAVGTDGEVHDLARYRGKPLLLDFWATWCAPCLREHPEVVKLAEAHGLAVLGISADEEHDVVKRWLVEHPTSWPSIVQGPNGAIVQAYEVSSWPTYALLDAEGKLVVLGDLSAVRSALEAL